MSRITPVVNRQDSRRPRLRKPGKPEPPFRLPFLAALKLASERARASRPELYASFEISRHQGATPFLLGSIRGATLAGSTEPPPRHSLAEPPAGP